MTRLLTLLAVAALPCGAFQEQDNAVELVFLNVGQGDAIVIRSPEGNVALIDAGNDAEVLPLLEWLGITAIDLVIASHLDSDHIGGIDDVVRSMPVYNYMDNGDRGDTQSYRSLVYALQQAQVNYIEATSQSMALGVPDRPPIRPRSPSLS
jgi:beta-lactamase superfamily II metal-dependent hydrolase